MPPNPWIFWVLIVEAVALGFGLGFLACIETVLYLDKRMDEEYARMAD